MATSQTTLTSKSLFRLDIKRLSNVWFTNTVQFISCAKNSRKMSYLSRREIDDLKPAIDKAVYKLLGTGDSSLVNTAVHCLNSGYDRRKTTDKLSSYVDSKRASRLAEKVFDIFDDVRHKSRKRSRSREREKVSGQLYFYDKFAIILF